MSNTDAKSLTILLARVLRVWLSHRQLPWILTALAMLLAVPSLWVGWQLDDHWHRMMIRGWPGYPGLYQTFWDQFTFGDGNPERTQRFLDYGFFPWWHELESCTLPWRPVGTLTHWFDYLVWPQSPFLMHLHSLLWFGAMVAAAAVLYRRLMTPAWVAGAAALMFAFDDAHGWAVGWLANRNAINSAFFGVLTLIAHDQWRRSESSWGAFLAPIWFVLAMLSAEASLAVCAYLFAYAVFLEPTFHNPKNGAKPLKTHLFSLAALAPYVVIAVLWQILYKALGFGAWGLGLYIDPGRDPLRFLGAVVERGPYLLLGQWAFPPSDIYVWLTESGQRGMWLAAVLSLAVLTIVMLPRLWRSASARFWFVGMIGSLIPVCSTLPQDRLLFFIGLGAFPLIAEFFASVFDSARKSRRITVAIALLLVVIHGPMAAIALPIRAYSPTIMQQVVDCIRTAPLGEEVAKQTVVIVNAPSHFYAMYLPIIRTLDGETPPKRVRSLGPNPESFGFEAVPMKIERVDDRTLRITPEGGYEARPVLRDPGNPLDLGDEIRVEGMTVKITGMTARGNAGEATFRFDVPLDDSSLCWLQWKDNTLVPFEVPKVGEWVEL